uniref:Uncharacterized protein n=1 Tax=viral metagenome TaxID=1070528 RepID=A0A6M3KFG3_9ZZZZ
MKVRDVAKGIKERKLLTTMFLVVMFLLLSTTNTSPESYCESFLHEEFPCKIMSTPDHSFSYWLEIPGGTVWKVTSDSG